MQTINQLRKFYHLKNVERACSVMGRKPSSAKRLIPWTQRSMRWTTRKTGKAGLKSFFGERKDLFLRNFLNSKKPSRKLPFIPEMKDIFLNKNYPILRKFSGSIGNNYIKI